MKRTYSKEFKMKACELVITDNIAVAVVAEKFGINHVMLHRWVSEYRELGNEAFVGKDINAKILFRKRFKWQWAEIRNVRRMRSATATEAVNTLPRRPKSWSKNTVLEKACPAREPRATINRSRASGTPSNVRCLISGISHSRRQA